MLLAQRNFLVQALFYRSAFPRASQVLWKAALETNQSDEDVRNGNQCVKVDILDENFELLHVTTRV